MAVWSEATAPTCYGHTSALAFQPPLYMCVCCKANPFSAPGAYPREVRSTATNTQADATLPCMGVRDGVNRGIAPGPRSQPFGGAPQRWCFWVHQGGGHTSPLFHIPHTTGHGEKHTCLSFGSPQTNCHMRLGRGV